MDGRDLRFDVSELDGCRLVEVIWPARLEPSGLAASLSYYLSLFDDGRPTVQITDITGLDGLDGMMFDVLKTVIDRVRIQSAFVGSTWVVGKNRGIGEAIARALAEVGRTVTLHSEREDAIEYLRGVIASRRPPP